TVVTYDNSSTNGGTVSYNNDGTFDYTPAANFNGTDTFTYTIEDADGQQSTATVTMTVSEGNDDPSAVADSYSTQEDTPVTTGNVLSNDDLGDTPTTVVTYDNSSTNGGTVSYNNDGTFDYTPAANFNGTDTFTYTIEDADGQQSTATVTMTVDRQNAAPDANDDPGSAPYSVQLGQFASDSSWSDASLSAFDANGNAATVGTYRAGNGFTNAKGVSGSQRTSVPVSKQIEFVEDTGTSESLVVQLNGNLTSATFAFSNLYANETDGAGGSNDEAGGWIAYYNGTEVASGQFSVNSGHAGTGSISAGGRVFNSVAFVAVDDGALRGDGYNDNSEYYLTGLEGSGPAEANSDYMTNEGQVLSVNVAGNGLLANDSDSDLDAISVLSVNDSGTSGAVTVNADGTFEYDPGNAFDSLAVGEIATDTFDYTISDGNGGLDTATVTITVIGSSNSAQGNRLESDHYSSAADDILTGGDGADTFIWRDGDSGIDTVQNFDLVEDSLDLSDLLQGATADSLDDYLSVGVNDEGDTSIDVVPLGDGSAPSQTVILDGVNLQDVYGTENSSLILANLVESNKLITE
ncbi:Ig-like domain-containing protein, partial [Motiliproteus sp. MSK22-1]|uniref:Ig-like domain-containing protein n=1 Tax=Motiliproteus sp. MSK22-1 TaxID=1897630 RepID=UPI00117D6024